MTLGVGLGICTPDVVALRWANRVGKGNTIEAIALAFKRGTLGELFEASVPSGIRGGKRPLQRVTGNTQSLAVPGK